MTLNYLVMKDFLYHSREINIFYGHQEVMKSFKQKDNMIIFIFLENNSA